MKTMRCSDAALVSIARETADRLRTEPGLSLQHHLANIERSPWPGLAMTSAQRKALRSMIIALYNQAASSEENVPALANILPAVTATDRLVA